MPSAKSEVVLPDKSNVVEIEALAVPSKLANPVIGPVN